MKHILLLKILNKLKGDPRLMKKVKIFAVVGLVGFFFAAGLTIWAGISAISYIASTANQAIQSPVTHSHLEDLKTDLKSLPKIQPVSCWAKAQSLISFQPWIERPALDNLIGLKAACFQPTEVRAAPEWTT